MTKFAVHYVVNATGEATVQHVTAPTPDAARKTVVEQLKPVAIIVRKIKRAA